LKDVVYILLATALTAAASTLAGNALLRSLLVQSPTVKLYRSEALFLGLVLGSGCLAAVAFAMAAAGQTHRSTSFLAAAAMIGLSLWRGGHKFPGERPGATMPRRWQFAFWAVYLVFGSLYLSIALAPEASLDGSSHYLSLVARWARQFGFAPGELRQSMPGGVEMLFLFAYTIGHHSAAAMVELLFLFALPLGILAYARRLGEPRAGVLAALLFFVSPVVGRTGTIAAPDVAIACVAFACFYLTDVAFMERQWRLLGPLAALLGLLAWDGAPWLVREFHKPIVHLNEWYPRMPLDLAVHGARLGSMLGAVFLMTPLALLALRKATGWRLWAAALIFAATCGFAIKTGAMETRLLIPALPFFSLALALTLVVWRMAAPAVLVAHAVMSWPAIVATYADRNADYLHGSEWGAALRIEHEDHYLLRSLPGFYTGMLIEKMIPDGSRILTLSAFQTVYHTRVVVDPESDEGRHLREVVRTALSDRRRFPTAALKDAGIGWLIAHFDDPGAFDLLGRADEWGLKIRSIEEGYLVFQVE
jgi:hypothetical protein